ncbi:MAG: hypothetical protein DMG16_03110, partial [Acidobacteria bacterium]
PTTLVNREVSELLSGGAVWHLKVAGCFLKMLHGFSRRKAASGRCRAGFQSRGLLPENAVRHLKLASCLPEMLRGPLIFRCPLSVFARCIKCGARVEAAAEA